MHTRLFATLIVASLGVAAGCDLPKDPEDSLNRIRQTGVLRAGISPHEPWTTLAGGGAEAEFLTAFAHSLGARVEWHPGSESVLFEALEKFEIDVVAGGLTHDNPWGPKLAMTRPYAESEGGKKHVIAVAPGENRLLLELDRALRAHAPAIAARAGAKPLS